MLCFFLVLSTVAAANGHSGLGSPDACLEAASDEEDSHLMSVQLLQKDQHISRAKADGVQHDASIKLDSGHGVRQEQAPDPPAAHEAAAPEAERPHIIFFISDDWGWNNVGYHYRDSGAPEGELLTPHIDALVAEGVELDRHYVYRWCTPTRSSLLSGRLPVHVNVAAGQSVCNRHMGIPPAMTTIADKLQLAGYQTHMVGKWDVGMATANHLPVNRGFASSLHFFDHCLDMYTYRPQTMFEGNEHVGGAGGPCPMHQNITDMWDTDGPASDAKTSGVYVEDLFYERAASVIEAHDPSSPLFLYYAFHIVHVDPLNHLPVPQEWLDMFSSITDSELRQRYAASVAYMDDAVGKTTELLRQKGMWDNTVVVMASDNGGGYYGGPDPPPAVNGGGANNYPLRGAKLSEFEGGIRVNAFVSGGFVPQEVRGTKLESFMHVADWYGTFCALAGVDAFDDRAAVAGLPPVDSVNAWPLISGTSMEPLRDVVHLSENTIMDVDGWKLLVSNCSPNAEGRLGCDVTNWDIWAPPAYPNADHPIGMDYTPGHNMVAGDCSAGCLFNVLEDPREEHDLSAQEPQVKQRLQSALAQAQQSMFSTPGTPNDAACCVAAENHGGFAGPFM